MTTNSACHFEQAEVAPAAADPLVHEVQNRNDIEEHEAETMPMKRKKAPKGKDKSKTKASKENDESKKLKSKKKSKRVTGDSHDDDS